MKETSPAPLVIHPTAAHTHTVILLHGLGASADILAYSNGILLLKTSTGQTLPERLPHFKFVLPTASLQRCTAKNRTKMRIWFNHRSFKADERNEDEEFMVEGLCRNSEVIGKLVRDEVKILDGKWERVFLGGLSEGCAMSLWTLLSLVDKRGEDGEARRLGGWIGLSGWLPFQEGIREVVDGVDEKEVEGGDWISFGDDGDGTDKEARPERNKLLEVANYVRRDIMGAEEAGADSLVSRRTPIFIGHGAEDERVVLRRGQSMMQTLNTMGLDVSWNLYEGLGHDLRGPDEIDDIVAFLEANINL